MSERANTYSDGPKRHYGDHHAGSYHNRHGQSYDDGHGAEYNHRTQRRDDDLDDDHGTMNTHHNYNPHYDLSHQDQSDYAYNDRHFDDAGYTELPPDQHYDRPPVHYPGAEFLRDSEAISDHVPDRVAEVWMKESRNQISFNDHDLRDISRPKYSNLTTTLAGFAGVTALLALIGFLALSSFPDLSPQDIIAMEGYEGEQPTRTPFNLSSLRDCAYGSDCSKSASAGVTQSQAPVEDAGQVVTDTELAQNTDSTAETSAVSRYAELKEIPAATFSGQSTNNTFTDQLQVLKQWSNVRGRPDINSDILASLAKGTTVTLLSQTGEWFEIEVFKNGQKIGYMHRSTVAAQ